MMKTISAAALAGVLFLTPACAIAETNTSETYRQLNLFGDVFERVRSEYVEPTTDEQLIETAINGMLTALDPHSSYLNRKSFQDMQVQTRGEFGGLGIEVTMENGLIKVVSPIDDTPAFRAGLQPGDLITHLDGEAISGMSLADAVEKMRGPVGSDIKVTIRRGEGAEPFDVAITRDTIKIQSVRYRQEGDVGYIRVTTFNEQTQTGLERAVERLQKEVGAQADGLCAGPPQQSRRPARSGDLGVRQLPGQGRDRLHPWPQAGRRPALQRQGAATSPRASRWSC